MQGFPSRNGLATISRQARRKIRKRPWRSSCATRGVQHENPADALVSCFGGVWCDLAKGGAARPEQRDPEMRQSCAAGRMHHHLDMRRAVGA